MPRNRDLFDDSTMTFGEHLEVLRVHVWKALIGLVVGTLVSLLIGNQIVGVLKEPINEALRRNNMAEATDDVGSPDIMAMVSDWWNGVEKPEPKPEPEPDPATGDEMLVKVPVENLKLAIEQAVPGSVVELPETETETKEEPKTAKSNDKSETEEEKQEAAEGQAVTQITSTEDTKMVWLLLKSEEIAQLRSLIDQSYSPIAHKVEEAFMTYLKVSIVAGFVLSSPWIFFQVWQFVAAGLFPHERSYVYKFLPLSLGLFLVGSVFCFYFVFPLVLDFLIGFNQWMGVVLRPRLSEYISFALLLPVMFGVSFQLPLVMLLIERIGIVSVEAYMKNWRMSVLVISILSMLLTPGEPYSMILMMVPLIVLYFLGIMLCRVKPKEAVDPLA